MKAERLDETRLLISLPLADMERLGISDMSIENKSTRSVIRGVLNTAGAKTGFDINSKSIVIEIMHYEGGCFLLVTAAKSERKKYRIKRDAKLMAFRFENAENLLCAAERLYKDGTAFEQSELYSCGEAYFLVLSCRIIPQRTLALLYEYGSACIKGESHIARIREFCVPVCLSGAVVKLGKSL